MILKFVNRIYLLEAINLSSRHCEFCPLSKTGRMPALFPYIFHIVDRSYVAIQVLPVTLSLKQCRSMLLKQIIGGLNEIHEASWLRTSSADRLSLSAELRIVNFIPCVITGVDQNMIKKPVIIG